MFTGLVETLGTIAATKPDGPGKLLGIEAPQIAGELVLGESVAINGCCLTVVRRDTRSADFQAGPETLSKTVLGDLRVGDRVNLERAMSADGRFGGHLVQGHVDGVGSIRSSQKDGEWITMWFSAGELAREMVPKGSVAVDGISLTVVDVSADAFSVALIPHTLAHTTLGFKKVGSRVNLETDVLGKYVLRYLRGLTSGGLTVEKLREAGFA